MRTLLVAVAVVAATACGSEAPAPGATPTRGSPAAGRGEWVAAFRVAEDPRDLDADAEELMRVAPDTLIVGPVGCHQGLAEELDTSEGAYFSGVVASTAPELDEAVEDARRSPSFGEPLFRGELPVLCG